MSYILDALRRSQAERERSQVPGLHAQPELGSARPVAPAANGAGAAVGTPGWVWPLLGAVLVLAASLVAVLLGRETVAPNTAAQAKPAPAAAPTATPAAIGIATTPAQMAAPVSAVPAVPTAPTTPTAETTAAPSLPVVVSAKPTPPATTTAEAKRPGPRPAAVAAPSPTPAAPIAPLTADMKRDWPPLVVGGSVWSDTASARFVILNGQVVREGESTAGGVLVERINPKSAVLRWREQRAELGL
jgi:general secretion pathway protein B